jgi:transposase
MNITTIGLDLAKSVFQVHGVDETGRAVLKKQLKRHQMAEFFALLPPCLIGMEACAGAHHWARKLKAYGHEVRLIAPQYVKPYVKSQKNDAADAEAICEAVGRPSMRFVAAKTVDQQSVLALHTARSGFVKARTALSNQIRGLLAEFGVVVPKGLSSLAQRVPEALEDGLNELTGVMRLLIQRLLEQVKQLDELVKRLELQIRQCAAQDESAKRLQQVPGIGPITATALVAGLGDVSQFKDGRQVAAWLGLVPRQHSSGGKTVLLGITKRGDSYLRTLLVHGARSAILAAQRRKEGPPSWMSRLLERKHPNVACVALANRNARIVWALLAHKRDYEAQYGMKGTDENLSVAQAL